MISSSGRNTSSKCRFERARGPLYIDGSIVPVPKKKLAVYNRMAKTARKVWLEHGALDGAEWVADDVKMGKGTSFPRKRQTQAR